MAALRLIGYWYRQAPDWETYLARAQSGPSNPNFKRREPPSEDQVRAGWEVLKSFEQWPDPRRFVDPDWDAKSREMVARHLTRGAHLVRYRGLSRCRFCAISVGSAELTDGVYYWPEGLAHYVREHDVRLPDEFVEHVASAPELFGEFEDPEFDHLGQRVREWANKPAFAAVFLAGQVHDGRPPPELEEDRSRWSWVDPLRMSAFAYHWVEIDLTWWLNFARR